MTVTKQRGGARPNTGRKPGTSDGGAMLRKTVTLDSRTITQAVELGDGELSEGLRRAVRIAAQATARHAARLNADPPRHAEYLAAMPEAVSRTQPGRPRPDLLRKEEMS